MSVQPQQLGLFLPEQDLDENVHHIGCCLAEWYRMRKRPHYALCGVELVDEPVEQGEGGLPDCTVCVEISQQEGYSCPMMLFGGGQ
jgi:hypothetical protein